MHTCVVRVFTACLSQDLTPPPTTDLRITARATYPARYPIPSHTPHHRYTHTHAMLPDVTQAAARRYTVHPVPRDLIPSTGESKAQILWVGCSDSWITECAALDVLPQETFVHRNLGNLMSNGDLSSASAIAYCVDLLEVSLGYVGMGKLEGGGDDG